MYVNSTPYPSVTDIIRPYVSTDFFTPESRERGSAVHAACAAHIQGLFIPPLEESHKPYFESFKRWSDRIDTVLLAETRLIDPVLGFCGQPDLICTLKNDTDVCLIDFKTGQAVDKSWAIQVSAYRYLSSADKQIYTTRGLTLRLKADGSGCLVDEYPRDCRPHFNVFKGLINAHKYFGG